MGQKPSTTNENKSKLPLTWIIKGQHKTHNPNPEQPIKFQYKTRRKSIESPKEKSITPINKSPTSNLAINGLKKLNNIIVNNKSDLKNTNEIKCRIIKTQNTTAVIRTKSEPNLATEKKHKHRRKSTRIKNAKNDFLPQFGYEIQDIDEFLTKATIEKPANIPVVLGFPSVLYQTRIGGYQAEISLPLGMVVNAVFKNQHWLYVQTPHAEEGYISYAACLPLGIIPSADDDKTSPCWETSTDVFPRPSGNLTDTEKLSSKSECSGRRCRNRRRQRHAASDCGERSVDRLYLRAAASSKSKGVRQTLLVIVIDYEKEGENTLSVSKGDVVALLSTHVKGWFWVKKKEGLEGFIPAAIAGHGFL